MELFMKGYEIPQRYRSLHMLGEYVVRLIMDGNTVWEARKTTRTFLADTMFEVPTGVTSISLCGVGGGGGGAVNGTLGGGSGGVLSDLNIPVVEGELIIVTLGEGGLPGLDGTPSTFGLLTMAGGDGTSYEGEGDPRDTCGGRHYDGILVSTHFGGQASPFADGGDGNDQPGLLGSGGGAGVIGGAGGAGRIVISWLEG